MRTKILAAVAVVSVAAAVGAADPAILRFQSDGPRGVGLKANDKTQAHSYFRSAGNERAGVWRAEPATCKWCSDRVRKSWVIFDNPAADTE